MLWKELLYLVCIEQQYFDSDFKVKSKFSNYKYNVSVLPVITNKVPKISTQVASNVN